MKMGIKEFRERISEVSTGDEVVIVTHHGRRVGRYIPERPSDLDINAWVEERKEFGRKWRAATPDWRDRLKSEGIDPDEVDE